MAREKIDSSYKREWKRFMAFVDERQAAGILLSNPKYLTRESVDLYFSTIVANNTKINPDSARRVVSSLQKFADTEEYISDNQRFIVESRVVLQALEHQRFLWVNEQADDLDPHSNLPKDVLTPTEHKKAFHCMLTECHQDWRDLTTSWSSCRLTWIWWVNLHPLKLPNIRTYLTGYGPYARDDPRDTECLSYILHGRNRLAKDSNRARKGDTHVEAKPRVVGATRHRDVWQCEINYVAVNLPN